MAIGWSYSIGNLTLLLQQVFGNFSNAIVNNKTVDYPGIFDNITALMTAAIGDESSSPIIAGLPAIPAFAQQAFKYLVGNFTNQFNSTAILIQSAEGQSQILINSNVSLTPGNASNYLMAPAIVNLFLSSLNNLTIQYMNFVRNVTRDMNNTYEIYKSNDAILNEIQYRAYSANASYQNMFVSITNLINSTILRTILSMNNSITAFNSSLNTTVRTNETYNTYMDSFRDTINSVSSSIRSVVDGQLAMYLISFSGSVSSYIDMYTTQLFDQFPSPLRQLIFRAFNETGGNNNCSFTLANNANNLFTAFGGARAFFNCSDNEQILFTEAQQLLNTTISTMMLDFNNTMAQFYSCATVRPMLSNGQNFSLVDCIKNLVSGGTPSSSDLITEFLGFLNQYLSFVGGGLSRFRGCLSSRFQSVSYTSSFLTKRFLNCTNITLS